MKTTIMVSAVATLMLAVTTEPAFAQQVRVGGSFRVGNDVFVSARLGTPRRLTERGRNRWSNRVAYRAGQRHRTNRRRSRAYFAELSVEHALLHADLRFLRQRLANRLHRDWHHVVGYSHRTFNDRAGPFGRGQDRGYGRGQDRDFDRNRPDRFDPPGRGRDGNRNRP